MKHRDLVAELERSGCTLLRHGAKSEPVPRHREINEFLAKKIIKSLAPATTSEG